MGRAGTHKEKKDTKRQIKDKRKFKNRNSIGKAKKKVGSEGRYTTRTMAIRRLQVSLKDFRRLCILKGIYPREPKKKFKGGNTTYFFAKDVQFLMHEPLLERFREQKAFLKKIRKALGRHVKLKARRLDGRRPVYIHPAQTAGCSSRSRSPAGCSGRRRRLPAARRCLLRAAAASCRVRPTQLSPAAVLRHLARPVWP